MLREVEYKLGDENSISFSSAEYLTYILSKFSNVFLADINLYDPDGNLIALSRPKINGKTTLPAPNNIANMAKPVVSTFFMR